MGLNDTPSGERTHIGFFGRRNAGKSSLVNAFTGQALSVVSDVKGTTTDPVYKSMELLPLGPVMIIDSPGFDDEGDLGRLRIEKTRQVMRKTDIAVLVADASVGITDSDRELSSLFSEFGIPCVTVFNKCDLVSAERKSGLSLQGLPVSALTGEGVTALKEKVAGFVKGGGTERCLVRDLLKPGDVCVLVTPIDDAAPKGRIILPQQQVLRDILDADAVAAVTKENTLEITLSSLARRPRMVITDSQVFAYVNSVTPADIPLTSFSILMARYKGQLEHALRNVKVIASLKDGDTVLISEGCTHHRQCGDIGTVKIPALLGKFTGKQINIETSSGTEFPEDLRRYSAVIHCGGCMLNEREMTYRQNTAEKQSVPFVNYGTAIAYMNGILSRSVSVFPGLKDLI